MGNLASISSHEQKMSRPKGKRNSSELERKWETDPSEQALGRGASSAGALGSARPPQPQVPEALHHTKPGKHLGGNLRLDS